MKYISLFDRCEREIAMNFESDKKYYKIIYKNVSQILTLYDFCLIEVISPFLVVTNQQILENTIRKIVKGYHVYMASLFSMVVDYVKTFAELRKELEDDQISNTADSKNGNLEKILSFNQGLVQLMNEEKEKNEEKVKEIKIDGSWHKISSHLFPINTQVKANLFVEYLLNEKLLFSKPTTKIPEPQEGVSTTNNYYKNRDKQKEISMANINNDGRSRKSEVSFIIDKRGSITNTEKTIKDDPIVNYSPRKSNKKMNFKSTPIPFSTNRNSVKINNIGERGILNNAEFGNPMEETDESNKNQSLSEMLKNYEQLAMKIQAAMSDKQIEDPYSIKNTVLNINAKLNLFKSDTEILNRSQIENGFGKHNNMFRDSILNINQNLRNLQSDTVHRKISTFGEEGNFLSGNIIRDDLSIIHENPENVEEKKWQQEENEIEEILRHKYLVNKKLSKINSRKTEKELGQLLENFISHREGLQSLGRKMRKSIKKIGSLNKLDFKRKDEEENSSPISKSFIHLEPFVYEGKSMNEVETQTGENIHDLSSITSHNSDGDNIILSLQKKQTLIQTELDAYKNIEIPKLLKTIQELKILRKNFEAELDESVKENAQLLNNIDEYKNIIKNLQKNNEDTEMNLYQANKDILQFEKDAEKKSAELEEMSNTVNELLSKKENMSSELKYLREELELLMNRNELILDDKKKAVALSESLLFKNTKLEKELFEIKEKLKDLQTASMFSEKKARNQNIASNMQVAFHGSEASNVSLANKKYLRSSSSKNKKSSTMKWESLKREISNSSSIANQIFSSKRDLNAKKNDKPLETNEQKDGDKHETVLKEMKNEKSGIYKEIIEKKEQNGISLEIDSSVEAINGEEKIEEINEILNSKFSLCPTTAIPFKLLVDSSTQCSNPKSLEYLESYSKEPDGSIGLIEEAKENLKAKIFPDESIPIRVLVDTSTQCSKPEASEYLKSYLAELAFDQEIAHEIEDLIGSVGKRKELIKAMMRSIDDENEKLVKKAQGSIARTPTKDESFMSETNDESMTGRFSNNKSSVSIMKEKREYDEVLEEPIQAGLKRKKTIRTHSDSNLTNLIQSENKNSLYSLEEDKYQQMYDNLKKIVDKGGLNEIKNNSMTVNAIMKSVLKIPIGVTDLKSLPLPSFDEFKDSIRKVQVLHIRCGTDCPHLKRFYGFLGYYRIRVNMKPAFVPHKRTITRLPKIMGFT